MLPHLTNQILVVLKTDCNGVNSALGEIGVIKCLEDYLLHTRAQTAICTMAGDEVVWKQPWYIEELVNDHLFDDTGSPLLTTAEEEFHAIVEDPTNAKLGYEMEIFESIEGILLNNRGVLEDLANNYCIENWEVVRNLPGVMVLTVKGAKVK